MSERLSGVWDIEGLCPLILEKLELDTISRKTTPSISSTIQDKVSLTKSTTQVLDNTTQCTDPGYNGCSTVLQYKDNTIARYNTNSTEH